MTVINTNIKSLISQNAMIKNNRDLGTAMQQLSTGKRINSAKDDAAGLAITSRMTAQIRGLDQAIRNGNDSISMLQTTEGAMIEMTNMLQRMRELSIQSANDTYTQDDRNYLDLEFQQLKTEINRITRDTQWNGMDVLNGTFVNDAGVAGKFRFQMGSNEGQVITHTIGAMGFVESTGDATVTTGGTAQVSTATIAGTYAAGDTVTLNINVGSTTETYTHTVVAGSTTIKDIADAVAAKINQTTGGSALASASVDSSGVITLTSKTEGTAGAFTIANSAASTADANDTPGITLATTTAAANDPKIQKMALSGSYTAGDLITMTIGSEKMEYRVSASDLLSGDAQTSLESIAQSIQKQAAFTGVTVTNSGSNLTFTGSSAITLGKSIDYVNTDGALTNIKDLDIKTSGNSNSAITEMDLAINRINQERAGIGATINRVTYATDNLTNVSQNTSESRSRILDTDYAKASAELARTQIISQASTAMLAQANQLPQTVLKLLQG